MASRAFAPSDKAQRWWLVAILAVASLARFWRFWAIPLTYDEYSTWNRIWPDLTSKYNSIPEPLDVPEFWEAVASDAHPGLHHMWYRFLGDFGLLYPNEWSIFLLKLPFLLAGVGVVWLAYVAVKRWMDGRSALLVAAILAVLQPAVMHAQIARPYALGMLFVMALAVTFKEVVDGRKRAVMWSAVWLALSMYAHYFAGLTAVGLGLVVALGYRQKLLPLLLVAAGGLVLFLPHLPITLQQFGHKDLGDFLAPPSPGFVLDHLSYVSNRMFAGGLTAVVFAGLMAFKGYRKERLAALAIWALPLVVGYAYSVLVGPILQHRVLVFGLPFLVAALVGGVWNGLPEPKRKFPLGVAALVMGVFALALVVKRDHYSVFYERSFDEVFDARHQDRLDFWDRDFTKAVFSDKMQRPDDCDGLPPQIQSMHPFIEVYGTLKYWGAGPCGLVSLPFRVDSMSSYLNFDAYLDTLVPGSECAFIGLTPHLDRPQPEYLGMMLDKYPALASHKGYHNGAWYWIEKEGATADDDALGDSWEFASGNEYGDVRSPKIERWEDAGWIFSRSTLALQEGPADMRYVCEFFKEGEPVFYRSVHAEEFRQPGDSVWDVHLGVYYEDVRQHRPDSLQFYWWNPSRSAFTADSPTLRTLPRNPWLYGLTQPLHSP